MAQEKKNHQDNKNLMEKDIQDLQPGMKIGKNIEHQYGGI